MLKQYLLSPTCLRCGSIFCEDSFFCKICYQDEIAPRAFLGESSHLFEYQHYYLFEWSKNESDVLSQMVYRLKSDNSRPAWSFYARLFYKKIGEKVDFKSYQAIIPVPSAKQSSVHSKIFARELSDISGLPLLDILSKKSESLEQKKLTARQRKQLSQIELKAPVSEHITKCIFVDDILTTGASFLQCNKVFGGNGGNPILTLFYRSRPADYI